MVVCKRVVHNTNHHQIVLHYDNFTVYSNNLKPFYTDSINGIKIRMKSDEMTYVSPYKNNV